MASSQSRIAETVALFYSADRTSDVSHAGASSYRYSLTLLSQGAMAGHAYKSAVDELDAGVGRELVSVSCSDYPKQRLMELNRTLHSERQFLTPSANSTAITPILTQLS